MPGRDGSILHLHILINLDDVDRQKWHRTSANALRSLADKIIATRADFNSVVDIDDGRSKLWSSPNA